ncbi:tetratricopeptide repeat-containing sensor histidine kinase [Ulvibacter litoralis]|uniref:histidine kinase n=1 Tax=Ulvibacter litoralis TaxID=227084 RepID=A0A1G7DGC5_9FLAO|nr:sensor histidine kinase [Ulvibacter litoralis]GHC43709.1 hypothetical protein GCM10008083_02700 [Ulvibacter litoralis]SDE50080.1 Two-component sensor histidine kinase, contains HisKA and HATPase domains [Ulvibacter litoralis]
MKTVLGFFLFLFFQTYTTLAQEKENDLSNVSLDSAISWLDQNRFESDTSYVSISEKIVRRAKRKKDYNKLGKIHTYISNWHYLNNTLYHSDSIIIHQERAIEAFRNAKDFQSVHEGYIGISMDYINNAEPDKAERAILKAIKYFEETNNDAWLAESYAQIAALYKYTKEPEKVIEYSELSYPILLKNREYLVACSVLWYTSDAYRMLENYEKAMQYIDQSIEMASTNDFSQSKDILVAAYETKGDIYSDQNLHDRALDFYKKAWEDNILLGGKENTDYFRYNIGRELFLQQKYKEALPHLIAGIKGKEHSEIEKVPEYYITLSKCYQMLGEYNLSLAMRDSAMHIKAKQDSEKIHLLKSEMIIKYETEKKDEAIAAQELLLVQKNNIQNLIIGIVALLSILLFLLFFFYRKNKKATEVISQKNAENELLLKEIHHRVKNNLEMVKSLLALQSSKLKDSASKDAMIASQNRVQSMGIIHQKLYQGKNLGSIDMKDYFTSLVEEVLDGFDSENKIQVECDMERIDLDVDTAVPIGLIVNELLTNSLKYAFPKDKKGKIVISLFKTTTGSLTLKFADNGVGKTETDTPKGSGFGTQLIHLLTQQLNGELTESSALGTSYVFNFKRNKAA